jgi:predicted transcriptional regulator
MPKVSESLPDEWLGGVYWQTLGDALYRLRRVFDTRMGRLYEGYAIQKPPPRERHLYVVEPLFDVGKLVGRDNAKKGLRLLRVFNELAEDKPTNLVLRTDAAVKAWLTTDEFDTVVRLLIEEGYIVRTKAARSEAYRLTPEGVRKGERYKLLAQGLNPDTGEPLQGQ